VRLLLVFGLLGAVLGIFLSWVISPVWLVLFVSLLCGMVFGDLAWYLNHKKKL
jgi:hypothetical protein